MADEGTPETSADITSRVWEQQIHSTPERIWEGLTDLDLTTHWYYRAAIESDWRPGSPVIYRGADGQIAAEGEIEVVEPQRMLALALGRPPVHETGKSRLSENWSSRSSSLPTEPTLMRASVPLRRATEAAMASSGRAG